MHLHWLKHLPALADTETFGQALGRCLAVGDVIALYGELGAGKTALAKGIARGVGFAGEVSSPTFPIVQVYEEAGMRLPLWHVDLYRIDDVSEVEELGLDDSRRDAALVIEWPERLGAMLWRNSLRLEIRRLAGEERSLTAHVPEAWEGRWPPR